MGEPTEPGQGFDRREAGDTARGARRPVIDDPNATLPGVVAVATVGRLLRGERERQGIGLDQIQAETHIRVAQLRAIEDDRLDALPAEAYARGFVRTYAELLGLDGDQMVQTFNDQWAASHGAGSDEGIVVPAPIASADASAGRAGRRIVMFALVALASSFAIFAIGRLASSGPGQRPSQSTVRPATAVPGSASTGPRTQAVARPHSVRIALTAPQAPCWLQARAGSGTGRVLTELTLNPGRTVHLHGRRVWVRLGDPGNARLRVNGRDVRVPFSAQPINLLITPHGVSHA